MSNQGVEVVGHKHVGGRRKLYVVLGSILGVTATIIGLIAVFFPDMFNLEKNTIAEFSVQVSKPDDSERLTKFLEANSKRIVKLDISICASLESRCGSIRQDDNSLVFADIPEGGECPGDGLDGGGVRFNFYDSADGGGNGTVWGWDKFAPCTSGSGEGVSVVSGYFLVPESSGYAMGWVEWMLSPISEKDVLLKKY